MSFGAYQEPPILKTAGGTIQLDISESGSVIVAAGASATTFRLPPIPAGAANAYRFTFFNAVDQNMIILPPATKGYDGASLTLGVTNNLAAASVTYSTSGQKIAACCSARAVGGKWWLVTESVGITPTIA